MADLDAYFVSLDANEGAVTEDQEEAAMAGGQIYRGGYEPYSIAACMSCHGPSGHGIPPSYPRVSGQVAEYLEAQLLAFKSGARSNAIMNPIAFALSAGTDQAIGALYVGSELTELKIAIPKRPGFCWAFVVIPSKSEL